MCGSAGSVGDGTGDAVDAGADEATCAAGVDPEGATSNDPPLEGSLPHAAGTDAAASNARKNAGNLRIDVTIR